MFGYLNLNDPTKIGAAESQVATAIRLDRGFLEYSNWPVRQTTNRVAKDQENREIFIDNEDIGVPGAIKRRFSSGATARLGTYNETLASAAWSPGTAAGSKPKFTAAATTDNRKYYAITCYDPDTNEESWPYFWEQDGATGFEIEALPGIATLHPTKVNAKWYVYRRPLGSSEYLRVPLTDIPAYTDQVGNRVDAFTDDQLGEPLNTVDVYPPGVYSQNELQYNILVHNRRLWFTRGTNEPATFIPDISVSGYPLYFSKTNIFGEIPVLNYFLFEGQITNIFSLDESLLVLTKEGIYVIYGDDESNFQVKEISSAKIGAVCLYSAEACGNVVMFVSNRVDDRNAIGEIYLVAGNQVRKISDNIQSTVPQATTIIPRGTATYEGRFIVVRISFLSYVYDLAANGFSLVPLDAPFFSYKTKEFGTPGWWTSARRMFVRGLGQFSATFWLDGQAVDTISFNIAGVIPQTIDFTVPPFRGNYFAVSFTGQPNAKIYEFGKKE